MDAKHPWHFVWKGTGEHYFYNGRTTYLPAGWDEKQVQQNLSRLVFVGRKAPTLSAVGLFNVSGFEMRQFAGPGAGFDADADRQSKFWGCSVAQRWFLLRRDVGSSSAGPFRAETTDWVPLQ